MKLTELETLKKIYKYIDNQNVYTCNILEHLKVEMRYSTPLTSEKLLDILLDKEVKRRFAAKFECSISMPSQTGSIRYTDKYGNNIWFPWIRPKRYISLKKDHVMTAIDVYKEKSKDIKYISLEEAKEMYKQGGVAKKVALKEFKEEKLKEVNWPKSWKEFDEDIYQHSPHDNILNQALAFYRLAKMAKNMNDGWEPYWGSGQPIYVILIINNNISVHSICYTYHPIAFKTKEMAEFSLNHHKSLWEQYYQNK